MTGQELLDWLWVQTPETLRKQVAVDISMAGEIAWTLEPTFSVFNWPEEEYELAPAGDEEQVPMILINGEYA